MKHHEHYILRGQEAVPASRREFSDWRRDNHPVHVGRSVVSAHDGPVKIDTVFIGLNHQPIGYPGGPEIFETLVSGVPLDQEMKRYSTWAEAEEGHRVTVEAVRQAAFMYQPC